MVLPSTPPFSSEMFNDTVFDDTRGYIIPYLIDNSIDITKYAINNLKLNSNSSIDLPYDIPTGG